MKSLCKTSSRVITRIARKMLAATGKIAKTPHADQHGASAGDAFRAHGPG